MNDIDNTEDAESYILSSKYRSLILEHLAGTGQATPKEIADSANVSRSHISRALSELQEKDVVELRVSEARTVGRYYGLTERGEEAWPKIRRALQNVEWTIEEPSTPEMCSVVEVAQDEFGDGLRCVGKYDGEVVTICYIDSDVRSEYSDKEFEEALRTLIFDHSLDEVSIPGKDFQSEILDFKYISVLRVRVPDGSTVAISFDKNQCGSVSAFTESVQSIID